MSTWGCVCVGVLEGAVRRGALPGGRSWTGMPLPWLFLEGAWQGCRRPCRCEVFCTLLSCSAPARSPWPIWDCVRRCLCAGGPVMNGNVCACLRGQWGAPGPCSLLRAVTWCLPCTRAGPPRKSHLPAAPSDVRLERIPLACRAPPIPHLPAPPARLALGSGWKEMPRPTRGPLAAAQGVALL